MVVIIGAGISGLIAANNLKKEFIILEKNDYCGGLSTQYYSNGYWFDFSGHYFHFKNKPAIKKYLEQFSNFRCHKRKSKIFMLNTYIPFPIQSHLSCLPKQLSRIILHEIPENPYPGGENLHEFLKYNFGKHLFNLFFQPFIQKYYQTNPKKIMAKMHKGSIPIPDKETIIQGFLGKRFHHLGYNPEFYFPQIPLRYFIKKMSNPVKNSLKLNETVEKIDLIKRTIFTNSGEYKYDWIINTMPLKELLKKIQPKNNLPESFYLKNISTLLVNVVLKKKKKRFHWVYLPEKDIPFYRMGFYPARYPPVCYLEKSFKFKIQNFNESVLKEQVIYTLKRLKIIDNESDIIYFDQKIIPISYIIFNLNWGKIVPQTLKNLEKLRIYSIGRYGTWNYTSMGDDVQMAINIAKLINEI